MCCNYGNKAGAEGLTKTLPPKCTVGQAFHGGNHAIGL